MEIYHPALGKCRIRHAIQKKHIVKDNPAWTFKNDSNKEQFYCDEQQDVIEENYQKYLVNENFNQCVVDIGKNRYRMEFDNMLQVNTFTEFSRKIKRLIVRK